MLRAKYLDWCSAQVADHFLALSPEEIYELAERAAQAETESAGRSLRASPDPVVPSGAGGESGAGEAAGAAAPAGTGTEALASYREVVERVTSVLADQLDLPDFEQWLELYRNDPGRVEAHLLGFWKEET